MTLRNLSGRLRDGRVAILAAAAWSWCDAPVQVAADQVEPLPAARPLSMHVLLEFARIHGAARRMRASSQG
jgi:hypothetical protein